MNEIYEKLRAAKLYDLSQPLTAGVPHYPTHPPFAMTMNKIHGEVILPGGGSSASETITMGGHVGTHIDALNHFTCAGKLFGGIEPRQSYAGGVTPHSVDTIQPIVRRGVLLDIATHLGHDALPDDFTITPEQLDEVAAKAGLTIVAGDVVLIRTGWARFWDNPRRFVQGSHGASQPTGPGPERPGAEWLSKKRIFAAGADTVCFERVPARDMPVHVHLLVESGIHIIENLNLDGLAAERITEFLFVAAPLKIKGGTGSPIRPFAAAV